MRIADEASARSMVIIILGEPLQFARKQLFPFLQQFDSVDRFIDLEAAQCPTDRLALYHPKRKLSSIRWRRVQRGSSPGLPAHA